MPYVRIEITDGATNAQKLQIYKETTEMLVRILGKNPEYTFVVIEEVDNNNWGHKGTSVALIREAEAKARAASGKGAAKAPAKKAPAKKAASSTPKAPAKKSAVSKSSAKKA